MIEYEKIDVKKLSKNIREVEDLLEANRDLLDTEEYIASRVTLNAVDIAIRNSRKDGLWDKFKNRRNGR